MEADEMARQALSEAVDDPLGIIMEVQKFPSIEKFHTFAVQGSMSWTTPIISNIGDHTGPRSLISKITRVGYFWPTMRKEAKDFVKRCDKCQKYGNVHRTPRKKMMIITSPWLTHYSLGDKQE